ncbi:DUF1080 domain-containing protein [Planctomycetota bacterium]
MQTTTLPAIGLRFSAVAMLLLLLGQTARAAEDGWTPLGADDNFAAWHQSGDWYEAGDAMLDPDNPRRLVAKPGAGVMINGEIGKTPSLVTRQTFADVEVHVEFMVAKGSNSGVIFHGNHEIQILDSAHEETPTGAHCGGVYPRAEGEPGTPTYHHIDKGSPPRVNAAKPPGQWQTLDVIFQAARFDENGNKTAHARFVKVVHNGIVIQEDVEVPYAHGPNWDRKQHPRGPIIFQGDYGPIAYRNIRVRPWSAGDEGSSAPPKGSRPSKLNVPPEGFTALFNGRDLTGWHTPPLVKQYWSIEDGVLKAHGLLEEWGADLSTKKQYRDFILLLDFRMPTISDSGINFRRLIPEIPGFGDQEQFNLRSKGGMGHLESYYFLPKPTAEKVGLMEEEKPHLRHIDPEVGVWHTVKLTIKGLTFSAEYDGELIHDNFVYHDWMMNMEPAPIRLQKHIVVHGDNLGAENPCPIEYRNIFIKELGPDEGKVQARPRAQAMEGGKPQGSSLAQLLARIDGNDLPKEYDPVKHQEYVDRRMAELSGEQQGRIGQLWKAKEKLDPDMPNRGFSFVRILEYVADGKLPPAANSSKEPEPDVDVPAKSRVGAAPAPAPHPVNRWKWSAETDEEGAKRKAIPLKISEEQTIHVAPFGVSGDDKPPVVLLPESRLRVRGRVAAAHPVYFGVTINHPNGDFAGRFQTVRPADEFQSGEDFEVALELRDFQLDPSLNEMKDRLPTAPFHFVVESIWLTTLDKQAGLEIAEVELPPPGGIE